MKTDNVLQQFADTMIARMEAMKNSQYKQAWLGTCFGGDAMNISGRVYTGCNQLFLLFFGMEHGWRFPVYATFKQYKALGATIKKGEKALPAVFWSPIITGADGKKISGEQYDAMGDDSKSQCKYHWFLKSYAVFNIDQTDLAEVNPVIIEKLQEHYKGFNPATDDSGMYQCEAFDKMIEERNWVCPINVKMTDDARYSKVLDNIEAPLKAQYKKKGQTEKETYIAGQAYYETILHEMAHSTGHKSRLNRLDTSKFGNKEYGKEELVAELSAALVSNRLGFDAKMQDDSATYLNAWIKTIKEQPNFIVSVMADVSKAVAMINERLGLR